jgi:hypothetical protein
VARKYPVPKPRPKFDVKLIKKKFKFGDTRFALTDKNIMRYDYLSKDWGVLYSGRYNDLDARWKQLCTLKKT